MDSETVEALGLLTARLAALEGRVDAIAPEPRPARNMLAEAMAAPQRARFQPGRQNPAESRDRARLMAARMAMRGRTSGEIAGHLRDTYGIEEDVADLLEEVGAPPE